MTTDLSNGQNVQKPLGVAVRLRKSFRLASALGFLLLALALYAPALGTGRFVFGTDTATHDYIMHMYGWQNSIGQRGELPLWCPQLFCGLPFIASAALCPFYPSQWLYAILPFNTGFTLQYVLAVAVGALGFAWWMRIFGHSRLLAFWGGCLFAVSGHFLSLTYAGHLQKMIAIGWSPFALGATVLVVRHAAHIRRNTALVRAAIILALAWAMQLLASHPQIFYGTAAACALYIAGAAIGAIPWRRVAGPDPEGTAIGQSGQQLLPIGKALLVLAAAGVVAMALAAAQVLPGAEMKSVSNRAQGVPLDEAVLTSYPPADIFEYIIPSIYGSSVDGAEVPYHGTWGVPPRSDRAGERIVTDFLGFPILILAAIGVILGRSRYRFYLLALGLLALLVGFGYYTPLYGLLYRFAPGFDGFRSPGTFMFLTNLATLGLAVYGLEVVIGAAKRASSAGWASAFQSSFASSPDSATPEPANPDTPPAKVKDNSGWLASPWLMGIAGIIILLCLVAATIALQENWNFNFRIATLDEKQRYHFYRNIMIVALELGLGLGLLLGSRWIPRAGVALLGIAAFGLPLVHNYTYLHFRPTAPYLDYLLNQPVLEELTAKGIPPIRMIEQNKLKSDAILSGVGTATGYHPVILENFEWLAGTHELESEAFTQALAVNYARSFDGRSPGEIAWAPFTRGRKGGRVEYLWQRNPTAPYVQPGNVLLVDGGRDAERAAKGAAPAAPQESTADAGAESEQLPAESASWTNTVIDREKATRYHLSPGPQPVRAWLMEYSPHRIALRAEAQPADPQGRALLPVAEFAAPGWQAYTADDRPVPVLQVNGAQRALALPAGEGVITMKYSPFSLRLGIFLTLLTTTLLLAAGGGTTVRRIRRIKKVFPRKGNPPPGTAQQTVKEENAEPAMDAPGNTTPGAKTKREGKWWAHQDSNLGPAGYEPAALTN